MNRAATVALKKKIREEFKQPCAIGYRVTVFVSGLNEVMFRAGNPNL
jgi:hypothetical protein